jgi:hypothetical protein
MFKPGDKVKVSALLIGGIAIASAPGTCLHKYLGTLPDYSNDED